MHLPLKSALALTTLAALILGTDFPAAAQTFDFESTPATYITPPQGGTRPGALTSLTQTSGGIIATFSRANGARFDIVQNTNNQSGKPASFGQNSLDPFFDPTQPLQVNFSTALTSVSVDFGDYGADADTLTLNAYSGPNGTGTLLTSNFVNYGTAAFPTFGTAIVSAPGIQSVTLVGTSNGAGFDDSVFYDNFRVSAPAAVPEPSSVLTFAVAGLGLGGLMVAARRRKGASSL